MVRLFACVLVLSCCCDPVHSTELKSPSEYWSDTRDYVTSPLRWDAAEWRLAGAAAVGIAAAYSVDAKVEDHFATPQNSTRSRGSVRDAIPLGVLMAGAFAAGALDNDGGLAGTGWDMGEAVVLGTLSSQLLKLAAGRERPYESDSHARFRHGGSSFPSGHTTAAFAAAQVLADELPPDQWGWRAVAYGLAGATAYARLDSNAHWLSDTVAGAALGMATGRFTSGRATSPHDGIALGIKPVHRGLMLTFSITPR